MLFDIGWPELLLIGAVALIVIGPKDLPRALRVAGFWVRKARTLSREFQSSIDQMIREAELDEVRDELKKATEFDVEKELREAIDPDNSLAQSIKPPELPDYFVEAEGPKPETAEPQAALPAPTETPLPGAIEGAESPLEPAEPASSIPEPAAPPSGVAEHAAEAPEPAPLPRPPAP